MSNEMIDKIRNHAKTELRAARFYKSVGNKEAEDIHRYAHKVLLRIIKQINQPNKQ